MSPMRRSAVAVASAFASALSSVSALALSPASAVASASALAAVLACTSAVSLAAAAARPEPATPPPPPATANQAPIVLPATGPNRQGPYYRISLPTAIYGHAAFDDLRDLRIRNGAGQAVPYAWLNSQTDTAPTVATESRQVPIFAVPAGGRPVGSASSQAALLGLQLQPDGSLALRATAAPGADANRATEWLIDASQVTGDLVQASFTLAADAQGIFPVTLDASDDLRQWRPLVDDEPLVRLDQGGQHIERLAIDLAPVRARYLRLRWREAGRQATLTGVTLDSSRSTPAAAPALEWSADVSPTSCADDHCDYPAPRGLPIDSLRIQLAEPNTLAPVRLSALDSGPATTTSRAAPRNPIFLLRHHRHRARNDIGSGGESPLLDTVVYRLARPGGGGGEWRSPTLALDGAAHVVIRLRTDGGPIAALGRVPPLLAFGARRPSLVFLARGNPPFTLGWRSPGAGAVAANDPSPVLPLRQLMPNLADGSDPARAAGDATVSLPTVPSARAEAALPAAPANDSAAGAGKPWLWAALVTGLILLAAMAWSLLRSLRTAAPANATKDGAELGGGGARPG